MVLSSLIKEWQTNILIRVLVTTETEDIMKVSLNKDPV